MATTELQKDFFFVSYPDFQLKDWKIYLLNVALISCMKLNKCFFSPQFYLFGIFCTSVSKKIYFTIGDLKMLPSFETHHINRVQYAMIQHFDQKLQKTENFLFVKNTQFWGYSAHPRLRLKAETWIFRHPNPSAKKMDMYELIRCFTLKMVAK